MPRRQLLFDPVLPANQPIHRRVDLVGGGVGHPHIRQGDIGPPVSA